MKWAVAIQVVYECDSFEEACVCAADFCRYGTPTPTAYEWTEPIEVAPVVEKAE